MNATLGDSALNFSGMFARIVALIGAVTVFLRRMTGGEHEPARASHR
jgi:hypothetical protein